MKRLHVSFKVRDLDASIGFYTRLFGSEPTLVRDRYAKWLIEDPRMNFVIESGEGVPGFSHAGLQSDNPEELHGVFERMKSAEAPYLPEGVTTCCYHKSEKSWTADPDGVMWEAFHTQHQTEERGDGPQIGSRAG
ncbi:VOC family protein [Maricaulis sp.]|uniref:VOC family protein n=1 Tax=Maricaulis sp. TaxID=1486257 RepID=UPI002B264954|nr:VOC family protein [Maricaulis sp.]